MDKALLDTVYNVETPEGVQLPLKPAGAGPRMLAYLIDLSVRVAAYIVIGIILSIFGNAGQGIMLIAFFLIEWWYPVFFELYQDGTTPGKKQFGLRVVHDDGTPITFAGSMIRNLLRTVDFLPLFYAAGVICTALNSSAKRIGDLAAGSIVIYDYKKQQREPINIAGTTMPIASLNTEEQNAIISYAERSNLLSDERALELAAILAPLLGEQDGQPDEVLKRMAKVLIGQR